MVLLGNAGKNYIALNDLHQAWVTYQLAYSRINISAVSMYALWVLGGLQNIKRDIAEWKEIEVLESIILRFFHFYPNPIHDSEPVVNSMRLVGINAPMQGVRELEVINCRVHDSLTHQNFTRESESLSRVKLTRVLRVGYVSYDLMDHPGGRLLRRLVTHHNLSRVEAISFPIVLMMEV